MKVQPSDIKSILLAAVLTVVGAQSKAADQVIDDQEILNIENLYKIPSVRKTDPKPVEAKTPSTSATTESVNTVTPPADINTMPVETVKVPEQKIENLTDLNKLSAFREVSVIQKKYLPKTERFQLYTGAGMTTNSPWFLNLGVKINLAYHFTESFGVELTSMFLTNSERQVAKEIRENNGVQAEKFVNTKSYVGADLMWVPIYGKLTLLNNSIIPFDMYFAAGGGTSSTNSQEGSVPTIHVATGQTFAITKSIAFRWDYSWSMFSATPVDSGTTKASKNSYNDLILTAGLSFFFPEAKYR
ncbi:MAG: outer membrane beta-barrel domain-containing protein [Bdellovibrio sp.]|nr:outer membrane beta-barrel domain-containing protein [Bdellovibrio sp.]